MTAPAEKNTMVVTAARRVSRTNTYVSFSLFLHAKNPTTSTNVTLRHVDMRSCRLEAARLGNPASRKAALRRLSRRVDDPRVIAFRHALEQKSALADPTVATRALHALAELRK